MENPSTRIAGCVKRDISISLFGQEMQSPMLLAPIGVQRIAHPEGELASARVAAAMGIPFIVSSVSSYSMEEIAQEMGNQPRWFQLYCSLEESVTRESGQTCRCKWLLGGNCHNRRHPDAWVRETDHINAYSPLIEGNGSGNYITDPAFCELLEKSPFDDKEAAYLKQIEIIDRPSLNWEDLRKIRDYTTLPILLKGILHPADAQLALDYGVDGIIVSNHGGRQLDHCIASLDAIRDISDVVKGRIPVLLDSGVRRGTDILKAIALGADAVLLGRPYIYGLAADGEEGVERVIAKLLHELDVSMALTGVKSIEELDGSILVMEKS